MVFVLSADRKPLNPCSEVRARKLLDSGRAYPIRLHPYTIVIKDLWSFNARTKEYRLKIDPGSRWSGLSILEEETGKVIWVAELQHRGGLIKKAMDLRRGFRRGRRNRLWSRKNEWGWREKKEKPKDAGKNWRYTKDPSRQGLNQPSLLHRPLTLHTWASRLLMLCPIKYVSYEDAKFDTQKYEDENINGVEYQQGSLAKFNSDREYVLDKYDRKCVFCGSSSRKLEVEHNIDRGSGSNRVSNLLLACHKCNAEKGQMSAKDYFELLAQREEKKLGRGLSEDERKQFTLHAKVKPEFLKHVAVTNSIRREFVKMLRESHPEIQLECSYGHVTKYNRYALGLPKAHWIDSLCVGRMRMPDISSLRSLKYVYIIKCKGHGNRQWQQHYGTYKRIAKVKGNEFSINAADGTPATLKTAESVTVTFEGETAQGKVRGRRKETEFRAETVRIDLEDGRMLRINKARDILEIVPKPATGKDKNGKSVIYAARAPGMPSSAPRAGKRLYGFETGDYVMADTKDGKKLARLMSPRAKGSFTLKSADGRNISISHSKLRTVQHNDGYEYSYQRLETVNVLTWLD